MWLCVYFPALLIPKDSSEPVAIYNEQQNYIVQLNEAAKQHGVELNMGLGSACALCANLHIVPYCQKQEYLKLSQLALRLYQLNSDICLEDSNVLLIRCDRHYYYYGGQSVLLRILLNKISQHFTPYHYATANTPEQAIVLAKARIDRVLSNQDVLSVLHQLATTQLGFDKKTQQQFARVGIRSVAALFALPMPDLAGRFSQQTIRYLYALKGTQPTTRNFFTPPNRFNETLPLPFDMDNHSHLLVSAKSLLDVLETYLRSRNQVATQIEFVFTDNQKGTYPLPIKSGQAKYYAADWLALLTLMLEKTRFSQPIRQMQLTCENPMSCSVSNDDFFVSNHTVLEAHKLFDLLRTRLGEEAFHTPDTSSFDLCKNWPSDAATPTFFALQPQPLKQHGRIIAGPQRLQTLWWQAPMKRDYFLLETKQSERLWVFRDNHKNWFLHGWFS